MKFEVQKNIGAFHISLCLIHRFKYVAYTRLCPNLVTNFKVILKNL